jgi:hypothetical protein
MFDVQATSYSTQYDQLMYVCEVCYDMLFTTDIIQPISPSLPW